MLSRLLILLVMLLSSTSYAGGVHTYAQENKLAELKHLIEADHSQLDALDEHGRTPLHYAAWSGHGEVVEYLIAKGARIDVPDKDKGWTALFFSVLSHKQIITPLLLKAGADLEQRDKRGRTPIFELRSVEQIEYNRKLGAKLDVVDNSGETPLSFALEKEAFECVRYYLDHGLDPKGARSNGRPIQNAARTKSIEMVRVLLDKGADPNPAVGIALYQPDTVMVSLLVSRGAKLESGGEAFANRITRVRLDDPNQFDYFLKRFPLDVEWKGEEGRGLLDLAVIATNVPLVHYLILRGADVNARDSLGDIPLHHLSTTLPTRVYCGNSFEEWTMNVRLYDPATGRSIDTSMSRTEAMDTMTVRIARLLLDAGADPNALGYHGETPIERASPGWNQSAIRLLAERGTDLKAIWGTKFADNFIWGWDHYNRLLEYFLEKGLTADLPPLLDECIQYNLKSAAQLLMKYGAKVTPSQRVEIENMTEHERN